MYEKRLIMEWSEEDYLMLSGIQHFAYCRRQWALIHVENQWAENFKTTDGEIMHKRVHNDSLFESRGDILITRGLRVHSSSLGISGQCDVVEFRRSNNGTRLNGREGRWQPYPVEYKHGKNGCHTEADELQLCAQAMCLEEMLCVPIREGALYYGEIKRRENIIFDGQMKDKVQMMIMEMHDLMKRGYTPTVKHHKGCRSCSLIDVCIPSLEHKESVASYLRRHAGD